MFSARRIRCLLVHDHILLRQGLRRLLEDEPEIEVVAESENAEDAWKQVLEHRPEVVITGATVFGFTPEKLGLLLRRLSPPTRVLFLCMEEDSKAADVRTDTACAVKSTSASELLDKIRQMRSARGAIKELPRKNRVDWPDSVPSPPTRALTVREREILKLLAEGRTVRSAADSLGLSAKTVDAHKFNLMRKLGIHNKAELVMWAIRKRLVKVPSSF
jgi:two-component system, NarL family, response regulator NreC